MHHPLLANVSFLRSASGLDSLPGDNGTEVVFAGRSNAGKSSAINAIFNRKGLARASKTPGRTQLINFFSLNDHQRVVDLPGYGYAKVSRAQQASWQALMGEYFAARRSVGGMFLIVDARRGIDPRDLEMLSFGEEIGLSNHVLLTKADKLKNQAASACLREAQSSLAHRATTQLFSALKHTGMDKARSKLEELLNQQIIR